MMAECRCQPHANAITPAAAIATEVTASSWLCHDDISVVDSQRCTCICLCGFLYGDVTASRRLFSQLFFSGRIHLPAAFQTSVSYISIYFSLPTSLFSNLPSSLSSSPAAESCKCRQYWRHSRLIIERQFCGARNLIAQ